MYLIYVIMFRAILSFFRYIPQETACIHKPKSKDELYMEILQSQLDELNRKVDEANTKLKLHQLNKKNNRQ